MNLANGRSSGAAARYHVILSTKPRFAATEGKKQRGLWFTRRAVGRLVRLSGASSARLPSTTLRDSGFRPLLNARWSRDSTEQSRARALSTVGRGRPTASGVPCGSPGTRINTGSFLESRRSCSDAKRCRSVARRRNSRSEDHNERSGRLTGGLPLRGKDLDIVSRQVIRRPRSRLRGGVVARARWP